MADGMKIVSDKWMLQSRQIVNWGSYGGWHEFRPSMDETMPVTLLAGASESGKSTLVDAQISLLYPSGTPYNKASNSGRSERNDYTYLRGMIGVSDSENGETPIFLRGKDADGTPQNIWGAIVDTYVNKTDGGLLSCGKFLYLNAGDGQDGLRRRYITWNRTIDPRLMDQYRNTPFTRSMFEKTYPECTTHTNAAAFHASIWQDMGLSADACRLLHKIQSADAPSKLDDIFKQGVLDIPESIRLAHETVDDYNRFNENFHSMEDKMARVAILQNIQTRYGEYAKQTSERREYEPINPDSEHGNATLSAWARSRMASEVRAGLPAAQRKVKESQEAIDRAMQRVGELNTRIDAVKERIQGIDGGSLQQLGKDLQRVRQDIDEASRQRHAIAERFEQVEGRLPDSEQTWDAKRAMLAETLDTYEERLKDANARFQQLVGERHDRQRDRDSLRRDYQRKLTHRTRISDDMDDARAYHAGDRIGRVRTAVCGRTDGRERTGRTVASGNERHLRAHRADHPRRQTPRARIRGENQRHRPETHDTTHVAVHRHRHAIRILRQRRLDVVETAIPGGLSVRRMAEKPDDVATVRRALRARHRRHEP